MKYRLNNEIQYNQKCEKMLLDALSEEIKVTRFRLDKLLDLLIGQFKEMELIKNGVYGRLNDWIILTIRQENELINDFIDQFKSNIKDQKLQIFKELKLNIE